MKRKFRIFIGTALCIIITLSLLIAKKINDKNKSEMLILTIPNFSFATIDLHSFTKKDIDKTKSRIILNHFSPTCEHCQYMAGAIIKDSQKLKDIQILMITSADSATTSKFNIDYRLYLLPNIVVLRDTNYQFPKDFGTGILPSFFIYEHDKLIKKVLGESKIENLIN